MVDNALIQLFLPILNAGLTAAGYAGVAIVQYDQPTQQGANTSPTLHYQKIGDRRFGFLGRSDVYDTVAQEMKHTETQLYESTFRITAWVIQNPTTPTAYTASDLVNSAAAIMQSEATTTTLQNAGVGVLRVTEVRNPFFLDDMDQHEASASFEFTLTHAQIIETVTPILNAAQLNIYRE